MTSFQCGFCHQGPFEQSEVIRIRTAHHEFVLCGGGNCVRRLFNMHDPATFPATGGICPSCENRPIVADVSERGNRKFSVCGQCLISMFFDVAGR